MKPAKPNNISTLDHSFSTEVAHPSRWPHTVIQIVSQTLGANVLAVGDSLPSAPALPEAQFKILTVKAASEKIGKWNRILKMACRTETIVIDGLFENIPDASRHRADLWQVIKDSPYFVFVLVTNDPAGVPPKLPNDWGKDGYANVCLAVVVDGDADANRQLLESLQKIPARFRALRIKPGLDLESIADWDRYIQWIIADTTSASSSLAPEAATAWVAQIRATCHANGIAFFHNHDGGDELSSFTDDGVDGPLEHPFAVAIDLRSKSLFSKASKTDSPGSADPPALVNSAELEEFSVESAPKTGNLEPCSIITETAQSDNTPTPPDESDLGVFVPEIVTVSPFDETDSVVNRLRFEGLDAIVRKGLKAFVEAGIALLEIRSDELWREGGYASFDDYCDRVLGFKANYANRISKHAVIAVELSKAKVPMDEAGNPILPQNEFQCRALAKLEGLPQRLKAWRLSVKRASGMPTAAIVAEVVCELKAKNSPPKVPAPSRKDRLKELIGRLRQAVDAESLDLVREIVTEFENLA